MNEERFTMIIMSDSTAGYYHYITEFFNEVFFFWMDWQNKITILTKRFFHVIKNPKLTSFSLFFSFFRLSFLKYLPIISSQKKLRPYISTPNTQNRVTPKHEFLNRSHRIETIRTTYKITEYTITGRFNIDISHVSIWRPPIRYWEPRVKRVPVAIISVITEASNSDAAAPWKNGLMSVIA